jgi:hypothetical protein
MAANLSDITEATGVLKLKSYLFEGLRNGVMLFFKSFLKLLIAAGMCMVKFAKNCKFQGLSLKLAELVNIFKN